MKSILTFILLLCVQASIGQTTYTDTLVQYQEDYVQKHEVVKEADKKYMAFFPISEAYRVKAQFQRKENSPWFLMETSGTMKKMYRVYGTLTFTLHGSSYSLNVYQSQSLLQTAEYKNHLFIPFTDATSGKESYAMGRYYDFSIEDIVNNSIVIDFNKVYNPYCAYVGGVYNCPIPPKENNLTVAVKAGEKAFTKEH